MEDGHTDDVRLSPGERLALLRIEATLGRDRRFARAMRGEPPVRTRRGLPWLTASVLLLASASILLAVLAIRTSNPTVIWCFAALWPLTLFQTFRLLRRLVRRGGRGSRRL
ncbi:DUF3040 domain-containing protein [Streptomyces sp. NPDC048751]|uniref:DUF3040 domain-containing protein n=1 Tax=Streptomyces sp. NPDC048751 TaxID=3365591 RepID=UPI00371EE348